MLETQSAKETRQIGVLLGAACQGGEVFLLEGDLGAGKTTLTQGIAEGLGIMGPVVSPTFIVLREYAGRLPLYHFDFYRLADSARALDLEFGEYIDGHGVCVIEWPHYAASLIPPSYLHLHLRLQGEEGRLITIEASGPQAPVVPPALLAQALTVTPGVEEYP